MRARRIPLPVSDQMGKYALLDSRSAQAIFHIQDVRHQTALREDETGDAGSVRTHRLQRLGMLRMLSGGSLQLFRHVGKQCVEIQLVDDLYWIRRRGLDIPADVIGSSRSGGASDLVSFGYRPRPSYRRYRFIAPPCPARRNHFRFDSTWSSER